MNRIVLAAAVLSAIAAHPALARETGVINQAGMYEQTMRFYLHPAHGFSHGLVVHSNGEHPAVIVNRRDVASADVGMVTIRMHPAMLPREPNTLLAAKF